MPIELLTRRALRALSQRPLVLFALAELREDAGARAALGDELAGSWRLAASVAFAARCERLGKEAASAPVKT